MSVGFYGKLPARGDFVRAGLPRGFVEPWDHWAAGVLSASREAMGTEWDDAWLEAPVWRFRLAPGTCGENAVLGVMLPSVDRVGRYFPLTFAAVFGAGSAMPSGCDAWLSECERAGRLALEEDAEPDRLAAMLSVPEAAGDAAAWADSLWWTDGAPRVEPTRLRLGPLPDPGMFVAMLGGRGSP